MKTLCYLLMLVAVSLYTASCTKEGDVGPIGEQGVQGERGEKGDTGPRGANGAKGDKGDTGPRGAAGAEGDKGDRGATGPRGETGPQGEQGDRGATGPAGPRGATGPQGPAGSVNVIYGGWEALKTTGRSLVMNVPQLTQAIIDRGVVAVYVRAYKGETLIGTYPLPSNVSPGIKINFTIALNTIAITSDSDMGAGDFQFRYVLIPGSVVATAGVNLQDYHAVKAAFGMVD